MKRGLLTLLAAALTCSCTGATNGHLEPSPRLIEQTATASVSVVSETPSSFSSEALHYRPSRYIAPSSPSTGHTFPTRVPPPNLEEAEAEAEVFLGGRGIDLNGHRCVSPTSGEGSRSGDFKMDVPRWFESQELSLVADARADLVLLRATKTSRLGAPVEIPELLVHEFVPGNRESEFVFEPGLAFPSPGSWIVIATAGPQWGCFQLEIPRDGVREFAREAAQARILAEHYPAPAEQRPPSVAFTTRDRETDPNSSMRDCVAIVSTADQARSGDWIIRPPLTLFETPATAERSKFLVIPLLQPSTQSEMEEWIRTSRTRLRITASWGSAHLYYVYEAESPSGYRGNPDGEIEFEHLIGAVLPARGDWIVVIDNGAAGDQWGCFLGPGMPSGTG